MWVSRQPDMHSVIGRQPAVSQQGTARRSRAQLGAASQAGKAAGGVSVVWVPITATNRGTARQKGCFVVFWGKPRTELCVLLPPSSPKALKLVCIEVRESGTTRDTLVGRESRTMFWGTHQKNPTFWGSQLLGKQPFGELRNPPFEK